MSRSSTLIVLGALVILAPYSGLPVAVRGILEVAFGALVLSFGLWMRAREVRRVAPDSPVQGEPAPSVPMAEAPTPPAGVSPI
jgi:hypothetical protein